MSVLSVKEKHEFIGLGSQPMSIERIIDEVEQATIDKVVEIITECKANCITGDYCIDNNTAGFTNELIIIIGGEQI